MVDVKELRIGNWVYYLGCRAKINSISVSSSCGYVSTFSSGIVTQNQIEPIPLTEDLILKCGFTESYSDSKGYIYSINGVKFLRCFFDIPSFFIETEEDDDLFNRPIDNLHQLQNIYYALIGQELEVEFKRNNYGKK